MYYAPTRRISAGLKYYDGEFMWTTSAYNIMFSFEPVSQTLIIGPIS